MVTLGLVARIDAAVESEDRLEDLLLQARGLVEEEPGTSVWFAFRFGRGEFGIFDAFQEEAARSAHLSGAVPGALTEHADLLDGEPQIEKVDVLAHKFDTGLVRKGVLLRLPIKPDHAGDAERFLLNGRDVAAREPATRAWFALRWENGDFGVFDVFPDAKARRAHLTGEIPRQLALHGLPWLSGLPQLSLVDVVAQKPDP